MSPLQWRQTSSFARLGDLQLDVEEQQLRVWAWHVWNVNDGSTVARGTATSQAGARAAAKKRALEGDPREGSR